MKIRFCTAVLLVRDTCELPCSPFTLNQEFVSVLLLEITDRRIPLVQMMLDVSKTAEPFNSLASGASKKRRAGFWSESC